MTTSHFNCNAISTDTYTIHTLLSTVIHVYVIIAMEHVILI
jgi:hypothetical protein